MNFILFSYFCCVLLLVANEGRSQRQDQNGIPEDDKPSLGQVLKAGPKIMKRLTTGDIYKGKGVKDNKIKNYSGVDPNDLDENGGQGRRSHDRKRRSPNRYQYDDYQDYDPSYRRPQRPRWNRRARNYGFFDDDEDDNQGYESYGQSDEWGGSYRSSEYRNSNGIVARSAESTGGGRGYGYQNKGDRSNQYRYGWRY